MVRTLPHTVGTYYQTTQLYESFVVFTKVWFLKGHWPLQAEGHAFFWNARNHLPNDKALKLQKTGTLQHVPQEVQFQIIMAFINHMTRVLLQ